MLNRSSGRRARNSVINRTSTEKNYQLKDKGANSNSYFQNSQRVKTFSYKEKITGSIPVSGPKYMRLDLKPSKELGFISSIPVKSLLMLAIRDNKAKAKGCSSEWFETQ